MTVLQLTCVKPLLDDAVCGTQLPAATPTTGAEDTQFTVVKPFEADGFCATQDPGVTFVTGVLLFVQVVTV